MSNFDKTKFSIRVDSDLLKMCDECIEKHNFLSRTELIENALRFYISYLTTRNIEDYLLKSLSALVTNTVQDSESRICRAYFKIAVELSKISNLIAHEYGVDAETMKKLQARCSDEVKRINGTVTFEEAYKYQNGVT